MTGPDTQDKDKDTEVIVFEGEDDVPGSVQDKGTVQDKDDGDDDDRRVVRGEGDDDAEERRQRNRDSRRQRKERHRKLWEENRTLRVQNEGFQKALGELNARLATIEEGSVEGVGRRIDASLAGAERAMSAAKDRLKRAMADQDADAVVAANEEIAQITVDRQRIQDDKRVFEERRTQAKDKPKDDRVQEDGDAVDPRRVEFERTMLRNASIFQRRNSWFDHDNDDEDTRMVKKLDAEVAAEGFNPASRDYWEELEARMKEELPHRFKGAKSNGKARDDDDNDDGERKVISMGSGRTSRHNKGGDGEYRLSRERVQAIKDAGMWDDPVERKKMVDGYKKWDREHPEKKGA